jgi:chemotaxis protein methyltransferase WspC
MSVEALVRFLGERTGLTPDALGRSFPAVVELRMRLLRLSRVEDYLDRLRRQPDELQALIDEVIVPETWFFRGGGLFEWLAGHVRQQILTRSLGPQQLFRVLSVPCSTGEEPLSLAIALAELGSGPGSWSIDAIDLCARSLERARRGFYGGLSFRQTRPELRERYFQACGSQWEIEATLRQSIRYRVGNLIDPDFLADEHAFDVIFCRNLFIYLGEAARRRALDNLERLLRPDGLLSMGFAEPLDTTSGRFLPTGPTGFFLYRRGSGTPEEESVGRVANPSYLSPVGRLANPSYPPQWLLASPPPGPQPTPLQVADPPPDLLALARQQADRGQLQEAITSCREFLTRERPCADAYSLLGVLHTAREESEEAVRCLERALYLDPGHREALLHLMLLRERRGESERAARLRRRLQRIPAGEEP